MAAANESQGLKIAVAIFVALTVILFVTTYFGFSNASQAESAKIAAEQKYAESQKTAATAISDATEIKDWLGYSKVEDTGALKDTVKKDTAKLKDRLQQLRSKVEEVVGAYKAAGGNDKKIDELKAAADVIYNQLASGEANRTFQLQGTYSSAMDALVELASNQVQLTTALSMDNQGLRKSLDDLNQINQQKLDVEVAAKTKASEDLNGEHQKHETDRQGLLTKVDNLQTENSKQATRIAALENDLNRLREQYTTDMSKQARLVRYYREASEKSDVVLGQPSGRVKFVDYVRNEVRVDVGRRNGVHEQMFFSVFDRNSPGLPTERPKAVIELIQVGNTESLARIDQTATKKLVSSIDNRTGRSAGPIRQGDMIYSPAFTAGEKQRFALIGKIDIDRNGVDDRQELRRMIEQGGGEVAYDLPQPSIGRETGSLTGPFSAYVLDERKPFKTFQSAGVDTAADDPAYEAKKAEARQKLRDEGVRPISIDKLLAQLGYNYTPYYTAPGRVERLDKVTSDALQKPKSRPGEGAAPAATTPTTPPPAGDKPEAKKGEEKPDDTDKPDADKDVPAPK